MPNELGEILCRPFREAQRNLRVASCRVRVMQIAHEIFSQVPKKNLANCHELIFATCRKKPPLNVKKKPGNLQGKNSCNLQNKNSRKMPEKSSQIAEKFSWQLASKFC